MYIGGRKYVRVHYALIVKNETPLCPKSPSMRGFVASLPVRLLFKYPPHNAFYPVSSIAAIRYLN